MIKHLIDSLFIFELVKNHSTKLSKCVYFVVEDSFDLFCVSSTHIARVHCCNFPKYVWVMRPISFHLLTFWQRFWVIKTCIGKRCLGWFCIETASSLDVWVRTHGGCSKQGQTTMTEPSKACPWLAASVLLMPTWSGSDFADAEGEVFKSSVEIDVKIEKNK